MASSVFTKWHTSIEGILQELEELEEAASPTCAKRTEIGKLIGKQNATCVSRAEWRFCCCEFSDMHVWVCALPQVAFVARRYDPDLKAL
jgi:hypothetical protein